MTAAPAPPPAVAPRMVPCPACGGSGLFAPSNAYRPFCSERCKSLDLGAWASERFRVAEQAPRDDTGQAPWH